MSTIQFITRSYRFDYAHRVMNECFKCFHLHGHCATIELTFKFNQSADIGYAIDFKEIKRVGCAWIDDHWDHGAIFNPLDASFINPCIKEKTKLWLMSLNGAGEYCNPTAENIAKELFMVMEILFNSYPNLKIHQIRFYETENCWTDCTKEAISEDERTNFYNTQYESIKSYALNKGIVEYDDRKVKEERAILPEPHSVDPRPFGGII